MTKVVAAMLLWWLTLFTSLKPLANLVARLLYAGAFLYLAQDSNNTATTSLRQQLETRTADDTPGETSIVLPCHGCLNLTKSFKNLT